MLLAGGGATGLGRQAVAVLVSEGPLWQFQALATDGFRLRDAGAVRAAASGGGLPVLELPEDRKPSLPAPRTRSRQYTVFVQH